MLTVECRDKCVRMSVGRHNRYFEDSKDSEVMEQLISGYSGLGKDVEATSLKHAELVQHHCTDWDFLRMLADPSVCARVNRGFARVGPIRTA